MFLGKLQKSVREKSVINPGPVIKVKVDSSVNSNLLKVLTVLL